MLRGFPWWSCRAVLRGGDRRAHAACHVEVGLTPRNNHCSTCGPDPRRRSPNPLAVTEFEAVTEPLTAAELGTAAQSTAVTMTAPWATSGRHMNGYGEAAMAHWRRWLPTRFAAIANPQEFFSVLGDRVAQEVDLLADALAGPDLPGEGFLGKVGRLRVATAAAEERVCSELVYLEPEPGAEQAEPDEQDEVTANPAAQELLARHRADRLEREQADLDHEREVEADYRRRMAGKTVSRIPATQGPAAATQPVRMQQVQAQPAQSPAPHTPATRTAATRPAAGPRTSDETPAPPPPNRHGSGRTG